MISRVVIAGSLVAQVLGQQGECVGEIDSMQDRCGALTNQEDCEAEGISPMSDGICDWKDAGMFVGGSGSLRPAGGTGMVVGDTSASYKPNAAEMPFMVDTSASLKPNVADGTGLLAGGTSASWNPNSESTAGEGCCFSIGYGTGKKPCCLTTDNSEVEACSTGNRRGGAAGWAKTCPDSADKAHAMINLAAAKATLASVKETIASVQENGKGKGKGKGKGLLRGKGKGKGKGLFGKGKGKGKGFLKGKGKGFLKGKGKGEDAGGMVVGGSSSTYSPGGMVVGDSSSTYSPGGMIVGDSSSTYSPTVADVVDETPPLMVGGPGSLGPLWTQDDSVERPAGEKSMGSWTMAVYTAEQQARLGVDETGNSVAASESFNPFIGGLVPSLIGGVDETETPLLGAPDSNGCTGGYQWCATENKCMRSWEEAELLDANQDGEVSGEEFSAYCTEVAGMFVGGSGSLRPVADAGMLVGGSGSLRPVADAGMLVGGSGSLRPVADAGMLVGGSGSLRPVADAGMLVGGSGSLRPVAGTVVGDTSASYSPN